MRLSIYHRTRYRFSEPQARLVQLLRLTPQNTHDQTVAQWRIDVDRDAKLRSGRDGFGNCVTMLYVEGPLDGIEIAVTGEVVTSHSHGVIHGASEPLPPALFLRATDATPADPAIATFARGAGGESVLGRLHAINEALHDRFVFDRGRPGGRILTLDGYPHRGQPIMLTEFGGIAYMPGNVPEAPGERTWGYSLAGNPGEFAQMFEALIDTVIHTALFSGFCYTQFADTFQEANGLLTADRVPKIPITQIARATRVSRMHIVGGV